VPVRPLGRIGVEVPLVGERVGRNVCQLPAQGIPALTYLLGKIVDHHWVVTSGHNDGSALFLP
jgi:hypothetical protein